VLGRVLPVAAVSACHPAHRLQAQLETSLSLLVLVLKVQEGALTFKPVVCMAALGRRVPSPYLLVQSHLAHHQTRQQEVTLMLQVEVAI